VTIMFFGGSRAVSRLNSAIRERLDDLMRKRCQILIADAIGGDRAVQQHLAEPDWDSIFSKELDKEVTDFGVRVLRTPVRAPMANSVCERLGGSLRRERLDFLIPINRCHLKMAVKEWGIHYNRGRPHSSLGPGIPEPNQESVPASDHRHKLPAGYRVGKTSVLGGLRHEYRLVKEAA